MQSRKPVIMTWLCFKIFTSNLVKIAMQLSSQRCPMEMREPVVMSWRRGRIALWKEFFFDLFKMARKFGFMILPLAT